MTNLNEIKSALQSANAHDLGNALESAGLNVELRGNRCADDAAASVEGWGTIFWDEQAGVEAGWVVNDYATDCGIPMDEDELFHELALIIRER